MPRSKVNVKLLNALWCQSKVFLTHGRTHRRSVLPGPYRYKLGGGGAIYNQTSLVNILQHHNWLMKKIMLKHLCIVHISLAKMGEPVITTCMIRDDKRSRHRPDSNPRPSVFVVHCLTPRPRQLSINWSTL